MASPARADVEAAVLKRGWLAHQAPDFQRAVLQKAQLVSLRACEYLFHAGDATGGVYGVVSGGVGVLIPGLGPRCAWRESSAPACGSVTARS